MKNKIKSKEQVVTVLMTMVEVILIFAALFIAGAYMGNDLEKNIIGFVISTIWNVINYQLCITDNKYLSIFTGAAIFLTFPIVLVSFMALVQIATMALGELLGLLLVLGLLIFLITRE